MFEEVPEQLKIADHIRRTAYYDSCKIFIDGIFEVTNKFMISLNDLPSAKSFPPKRLPAFQAMLGLVAQNRRSLVILAKAASEGFEEDALVLMRVMYERHINISLIGSDPETYGPQYLRFQLISNRRKICSAAVSSSEVLGDGTVEDTERIRSEADRFLRDYYPQHKKLPRYWHCMEIAKAAEAAGLKSQHDVGYGFLSDYTHSQGISIPVALTETLSEPSEIVRSSPPAGRIGDITASALALFLRGWAELSKRFQPGELHQIKLLLGNYAKKAFPNEDIRIDL